MLVLVVPLPSSDPGRYWAGTLSSEHSRCSYTVPSLKNMALVTKLNGLR